MTDAATAVHRHTGRFVDHEHQPVFEQYLTEQRTA
jgi:hypothetical protein